MTLPELKKSLHDNIEKSNNVGLLKQIDFLLEHKDKLFKIPKAHLMDIMQGEQEINNGDFLTYEEFEKRYEKYLK